MCRLAFAVALFTSSLSFAAPKAPERLNDAADLLSEIMATPDKGIPQDLLGKAQCIVLVPGLKKAGFVLGAKYGKGFVVCRMEAGGWGPPAAIRIEGGSIGLQIGASSTDVVLLVMNQRGMKHLLSSKFTLGGEATVAAGPVGRDATAQTDAFLAAEILSYSRSRGVFAGLSLDGSTLRQDVDDNEEIYGRKLENRTIITGTVTAPASAARLLQQLNKYSMRKG